MNPYGNHVQDYSRVEMTSILEYFASIHCRTFADKLQRTKAATEETFSKQVLIFHKVKSLTGFSSFSAKVFCLDWIFI